MTRIEFSVPAENVRQVEAGLLLRIGRARRELAQLGVLPNQAPDTSGALEVVAGAPARLAARATVEGRPS